MMAFTEAEYVAIQDLLELDGDLDTGLSSQLLKLKGEAKKSAIEAFILKVSSKLKNRPKVEFPTPCDWFNSSEPWKSAHLQGRLTLLDFWTYCCINCMQILPDLEALEETFEYNSNVLVIGVHSAKFDNERVGNNILNAIQRYDIKHPVINDTQAVMWQNLSISCWPTILLCDPFGKPLKFFVGEGHRQDMIDFVEVALKVFEKDLGGGIEVPKIEYGLKSSESFLKYPGKVLVKDDFIFVADSGNHRIVISDLNGKIKFVVGDGIKGHSDGSFKDSRFNSPQGLAYHKDSKCLYVCDTNNHVIRCINLDQCLVTTIAGNGNQSRNSSIANNSQSLDVALASPWDLCFAQDNSNLLIAMAGSHQIWSLNLETNILTLKSGTGKEENRNNSYPLKASFAQPSGLSLHEDILYIADSESSSVRQFHEKDGVKNVCGGSKNPLDLFSFGDQDGKGTDAKLQHPLGVAFVPANPDLNLDDQLFIADSYNHRLKVVTDLKAKTAVCNTCPLEGLSEPGGLCFDGLQSLYIADTNNHVIKKVNVANFEVTEVVFEDSTSGQEEVDFTKASSILKASKTKDVEIKISIGNEFSLNSEAPNGWKVEFPPKSSLPMIKGAIEQNLAFTIPATKNDVEFYTITIKVYLCKDGICTVRNKKVIVELNQPDDNQNKYEIDI